MSLSIVNYRDPMYDDYFVFNWDLAAQILRDRNVQTACAGLSEDLEATGAAILHNRNPILGSGAYLQSKWATPVLIIDGVEHDCWKLARDYIDHAIDKIWPQHALDIFYGKTNVIDGNCSEVKYENKLDVNVALLEQMTSGAYK